MGRSHSARLGARNSSWCVLSFPTSCFRNSSHRSARRLVTLGPYERPARSAERIAAAVCRTAPGDASNVSLFAEKQVNVVEPVFVSSRSRARRRTRRPQLPFRAPSWKLQCDVRHDEPVRGRSRARARRTRRPVAGHREEEFVHRRTRHVRSPVPRQLDGRVRRRFQTTCATRASWLDGIALAVSD